MRTFLPLLLAGSLLAGCQLPDLLSRTEKVDNPVTGPPPPRMSLAEQDAARRKDTSSDTPEILQAKAAGGSRILPAPDELSDSQVVATVNGDPIFASEILNHFRPQLAAARKQLPPEEFAQVRNAWIHQNLMPRVERVVLVQAMKSKLKQEQISAIDEQLDIMFQDEITNLKTQLNASTIVELEHKLAREGESLQNLRTEFGNQQLAMEYLKSESKAQREFSRRELFNYYQEHQQDYAIPARVKWQRIVIVHARHGGKAGAFGVLDKAIKKLRNGVAFDEVARESSDDLSAEDGGHWDGWMSIGTLSDKTLEKLLFSEAVGAISQAPGSDSKFTLVRVVEREEARVIPFSEKQNEIKQLLLSEGQNNSTKDLIEKLVKEAIVEVLVPRPQFNVPGANSGRR